MIGQNLKKIRTTQTRYSQQEVTDFLGIERNTYARWESNENDVKSEYIPKLAELLKVPIHELFENSKPLAINNIGNEYKDQSSFNGAVIVLTDKKMVEKILKGLSDNIDGSSEVS